MQGAVNPRDSFSQKILALVIGGSANVPTDFGNDPDDAQVRYIKAIGPEEALQLLSNEIVDVVLIDADRQDCDFETVVAKVRSARKDVICAVVTDVGNDEMWLKALNAGACDLLEKRGLTSALYQLIQRQLRRVAA